MAIDMRWNSRYANIKKSLRLIIIYVSRNESLAIIKLMLKLLLIVPAVIDVIPGSSHATSVGTVVLERML